MPSSVLALVFAVVPDAVSAPELMLPASVDEAIVRCETLEYSQPDQALMLAAHGLTLEPRSPSQHGQLLGCKAWSQMMLGQMDEARALTLVIDQLIGEVEQPGERVELLLRLAQLHYRGGDQISALEVMDTALDLAERQALDRQLPNVLGNFAIYLTEAGQFDPAIEHFERLFALIERGSESSQQVPPIPVRYNLARAQVMAGYPEQALSHLEWLVPAMMQAPGMEPRVATALAMKGDAWRQLGDFDRAAELFDQAERMHQQFDNPGELSVLRREQSILAMERGDLAAAEDYGRQALSLSRQIEYEPAILNALKHLVDVLARRGSHAEALDLHREYAERDRSFLERAQRSRLDTLETQLGVQRQARELDELRQEAEIQQLKLSEETFRRRVAWAILFAVLALAAGLALWQRANQQRLLKASRTDILTGLPNRRYLTLQIQQRLESSAGGVLVLLDLDHFKQINDQYGHDMGDRALLAVSRVIEQAAAAHGALCGRWGGEEFALFLPEATAESASKLSGQLLEQIAGVEFFDDQGERIPVTASLGFAPIHALARDSGQEAWEPALKAADLLLYRAKHAGRNRGFGAWPAEAAEPINPLALEDAVSFGRFQLMRVPDASI